MNHSIGIIGGADGPTVVLTSGSPVWLIAVGVIALLAVGVTVFLIARNRK